MSEAPSKFIEGTNLQWCFDSQDLGAAKDCARKYLYQSIRGLRRKHNNTNQTFGAAFHKGLEVFELNKAQGRGLAIEAAVEAARSESATMEDGRAKTKESLINSLVAYIAHHEKEPLKTLLTTEGKPAVELHLRATLCLEDGEDEIVYCGYIDRGVEWNSQPWVMDHKTTSAALSTEKGSKAFFAQWNPDLQMTGYCWLANENGIPVKGVLIDAMQVAKTKVEFSRAATMRTPAQLEEWRESAVDTVRQITAYGERALSSGLPVEDQAKFYPMNSRACHSKYGPCTFAPICGKDPSVRESFLSADFEVKMWNPLEVRNTGEIATETGDEE